jgi:hypothetical protein
VRSGLVRQQFQRHRVIVRDDREGSTVHTPFSDVLCVSQLGRARTEGACTPDRVKRLTSICEGEET